MALSPWAGTRPLLIAAVAILITQTVHAQAPLQNEAQWVAPYPQLPEYREVHGRGGAFERRTGTPTPQTQPCVDREMALRMFHLDARWRVVMECQSTLTWSAWTPDRGDTLPGPVAAAPGYHWMQRTPDVPDYREFTGRLFGEAAAALHAPDGWTLAGDGASQ